MMPPRKSRRPIANNKIASIINNVTTRIARLIVIPPNKEEDDADDVGDSDDNEEGDDNDEAARFASLTGVAVIVGFGVKDEIEVGLALKAVFATSGVVVRRASCLLVVFVTSLIGREVGVTHCVEELNTGYSVTVGRA